MLVYTYSYYYIIIIIRIIIIIIIIIILYQFQTYSFKFPGYIELLHSLAVKLDESRYQMNVSGLFDCSSASGEPHRGVGYEACDEQSLHEDPTSRDV